MSGLMGDEAFTLGIRNAEVTMDYTSYEPVEPCVLPEGAKEAAETVDSTITEEEIEGLMRQVSRHQQPAPSEETEAAPDQLEL